MRILGCRKFGHAATITFCEVDGVVGRTTPEEAQGRLTVGRSTELRRVGTSEMGKNESRRIVSMKSERKARKEVQSDVARSLL